MKIAHVVTYISPDGAYGGPSRVALGQAAALSEMGHDVTVYAAAPPGLAGDSTRDGYKLRTFSARRAAPGGGFAALSTPGLTRALKKELPTVDIVHVHLARDLVTLQAARAAQVAEVPFVVQPHGMIDPSHRVLAKPLDHFVTRPLLRRARSVLALTEREIGDLMAVEPLAKVVRIANGIRVGALPPYEARDDVVLFLARLHERKRPLALVEMAGLLSESFPHTAFVIVGPDEGQATKIMEAISAAGLSEQVRWVGPASPEDTDGWITSARVYVLPAFGEVFPMTILEALRGGTPVVTTDSLGIADKCQQFDAALVTDGSPRALAAAVATVLNERAVAERLRAGGLAYLHAELDIARVAHQLDATYLDATGAGT